MKDRKILVSLNELENAFCEWDRRYSEDKEHFNREIEALLKVAKGRHSMVCALYLLKLVEETSKHDVSEPQEG